MSAELARKDADDVHPYVVPRECNDRGIAVRESDPSLALGTTRRRAFRVHPRLLHFREIPRPRFSRREVIVRITLFGATGRTGRRVVEYALAEGHDVTAYVRDPARLATSDARLHVAVGDVLDAASVAEAVEGSD